MSLTAREVMRSNIKVVSPEMKLSDLERLLVDACIGGAPVVSEDRVVGVISRTDIVKQVSVGHSLAEYLFSDYYRDISGFGEPRSLEQIAAETAQKEKIIGSRLFEFRVKDAMVENIVSVAPETSLRDVARQMIDRSIHRILVLEGRRLVGIVTSLDIVRAYAEGTDAD